MCSKIISCFYSEKTRFMIFFTLVLHLFDIISDIIVTIDLKNDNSEYFYTSFGILLFSFISSALLSLNDDDFRAYSAIEREYIINSNNYNCTLYKHIFKLYFKQCNWMIMDILQYKYISQSLLLIINNQISLSDINELTDKRIKEALLESGPEALFQLFIILNQSNNKTFLELITYYLSVKVSLLSLTNTLVSFEINSLKMINYLGNSLHNSYTNLDNISYTSKYMKNIIVFRLTEVFSRIGLLSSISQVYNGYYLFFFILLDYVIINFLNIIKRILRFKIEKCEYSIAGLDSMKDANYVLNYRQFKDAISFNNNSSINNYNACKIQLAWRLYKHDSIKNIFKSMYILEYNKEIHIKWINYEKNKKETLEKEKEKLLHNKILLEFHGIKHLLNNIKQLGVYSNPLSLRLMKEIRRKRKKEFYYKVGIDVKLPSDEYWWNKISMHFISKYINHLIISGLLIYNLTNENQSTTIIVISISSISCFIINMFSLYKITSLITQYLNGCQDNLFDSTLNFKCGCKCLHDNNNDDNNNDNNNDNDNDNDNKIKTIISINTTT